MQKSAKRVEIEIEMEWKMQRMRGEKGNRMGHGGIKEIKTVYH